LKNQTQDVRITNYNIIDWKITPLTKDPTMTKQQQFLHAANTGDLATFLQILNDNSIDPNHADEYGNTALTGAAEHGQSNIVRALLTDQRFDPNLSDKDGYTALLLASIKGHDKVVSALLADMRTDPNLADKKGCTALMLASGEGHAAAAEVLLTHERVDPNLSDRDGYTALYRAALRGDDQMVVALLAHERIDPNLIDQDGDTALILASGQGHAAAVEVLLTHERVDPNLINKHGWTALLRASLKGHDKVVSALLAHERIDPNLVDQNGETALMYASIQKHTETVKTLLAHEHVDPNLSDKDGYTALYRAALRGDDQMVVALLANERIDPNLINKHGLTTLLRASIKGYDNVVSALLADMRTDPNLADKKGWTALMHATKNGHTEAVIALLANTRTNPNIIDNQKCTVLLHAINLGFVTILKKLLTCKRTDPNIADNVKETALMWAAKKGHTEAITALLTDTRTNPNIADSENGCTALLHVTKNGHTKAVIALLANTRTNPNLTDIAGQTALTAASANGHAEAVKALLANPRTDTEITDSDGSNALMLAAKNGHTAAIKLFLSDKRIDPNILDLCNCTALMHATIHKHTEAVKALLADKRVDPNLINKDGWTALHYAKKRKHNDVLEILILDARVIKTLDSKNITSLLSMRTSDRTLQRIISANPSLTYSILLHEFISNKSKTELLKHCENIEFFAPKTDGRQILIQLISDNRDLLKKVKVPKRFTQTTATYELVHHLKVLQNLFKIDSLPTFEKHIQTWSPILSKQTISFFEQLNERDKEDLITYIHEWYTLYSASSVLNAQGDFSEVIACVKKDHRSDWGAILAAHKTYTRLQDTANLHDFKPDVESFLENLERSFYIKTYGLNLNATEFNEAIQDYYNTLCQKAQQAGTKIQTNYMKTAREDVLGHLKTNYPKFLKRNEQALSYSFVEQEKESPIYCQIIHTGPKQPDKVMDINLDLKERTLRTPQKIPLAFTAEGILTELLSLYTILDDNDNLEERVGEKTLSCLRVCCKLLIGKDLPVTVTNLQNLLDALQNDPKRTKMSCLLWSCSQPEPSQTSQLGLFTPATQTSSVSNGAASDAVDDIKTTDGSSGSAAAEPPRGNTVKSSTKVSPPNKPSLDIKKARILKNIKMTKNNIFLSLSDPETAENIRTTQLLFLKQLYQTVAILEQALYDLHQESFDSTHCLNPLLENQKTLKETYEFLEKEKHDYTEFIYEIFSDVQEHYKSTVTFITAHSTLQLHPSKASDKPALSTPKTTESSKAHINTILDACLKIYIRELRSKLTEDYTIPLLDFLKKTYQLVRTLRAQDVAEESKQKSFEAIADHLLYFTPLEACLNSDIQTTEITKKITQSLLKNQHSQQHGETALSNAGLLVRLLISNPNLLGDKNILFLLFCLHDCTKRHRPQLPVDSAVFKLRAMRNTFCHPKGQEAAEETSLGLGEKQELINYFASVSLSDQPLPLMHCTR